MGALVCRTSATGDGRVSASACSDCDRAVAAVRECDVLETVKMECDGAVDVVDAETALRGEREGGNGDGGGETQAAIGPPVHNIKIMNQSTAAHMCHDLTRGWQCNTSIE